MSDSKINTMFRQSVIVLATGKSGNSIIDDLMIGFSMHKLIHHKASVQIHIILPRYCTNEQPVSSIDVRLMIGCFMDKHNQS